MYQVPLNTYALGMTSGGLCHTAGGSDLYFRGDPAPQS